MNVLIAGGSWGCGELTQIRGKHVVTHLGIEQYFKDAGHTVTNMSRRGGSNKQAVNDIKEQFKNFEIILWFQTDPIRDLRPYRDVSFSFDKIIAQQKELINNTYYELNNIGKTIYCIGSSTELDIELIEQYNKLIPLIRSITALLAPTYNHPKVWLSEWINYLTKKNISYNDLDKYVSEKKLQDDLYNYKDLFWPDGVHPNRYGHKILFDYITAKLGISCNNT